MPTISLKIDLHMLATAFVMQIHEHRMTYNYQKNIFFSCNSSFLISIDDKKMIEKVISRYNFPKLKIKMHTLTTHAMSMPSSWIILNFPFFLRPFFNN